jgi:predicted MPP superfamily phosphohydrolase
MWLFRSGLVVLGYSGLCAYIAARIFTLTRFFLPGFKAWLFWPLAALCAYAFILINVLHLDRFYAARQTGYYLIAAFVYLLLTLLLFDALRLVLWFARRPLLTRQFTAAGIGAALCVTLLVIVYGSFHARNIRTVHYELVISKNGKDRGLTQAQRIALISDLHIGGTVDRAWVAKIVDKVNEARPDLVCIAGDIFDGNLVIVKDMDGIAAELRRLNARNGVYACLGNHDVDRIRVIVNDISAAPARIVDFLKQANITLLQDEAAAVTKTLIIAGRRDARPIGMNASRRLSADELLAPLDKNAAIIVLDHQPTQFPQLEAAGADLLFCGHSHRGQIFPANLVTRAIFKKAGGTHYGYWQGKTLASRASPMQAVVTSGAGLWGPPLRIATNSEVAVIDLRFK